MSSTKIIKKEKPEVILLTNYDSIKGRKMLESFQERNIKIEKIIAIKTGINYNIKLFGFVSKRIGFIEATIFSFYKIACDYIHEIFLCDLESLNNLASKNKIPLVIIKDDGNWQKIASETIDDSNAKIIVMGQLGILGKDFDLKRNDRLFLNCHPGKLPEYRGLDSFKWAILNKDWENFSCTIHIARQKIDAGEILEINNYNWRKLNWLFLDRQLLVISGIDLVNFINKLSPNDTLNEIHKIKNIEGNNFDLYNKINIYNEMKCLIIYLIRKYY